MAKQKFSVKKNIIRHLREWHRQLGIFAAFFLIFLSISGIALNHTQALNLDQKHITTNWLLDLYGIEAPSHVSGFQQGQAVVIDQFVWLNGKLLGEQTEPVLSVAKFQQYWLVLTPTNITIFDDQGLLIDKLDSSYGLPEELTAMAIDEQTVIVNSSQGYYQSDRQLIDWQEVQALFEPEWIEAIALQPEQQQLAVSQYRSQMLTLERVILDAHSGRIFGDAGVYFMDFIAICMILLSLSGIYVWLRYRQNKR
ncbi:PepSY domain-containing protein [Thalassotalea ganghwensis]